MSSLTIINYHYVRDIRESSYPNLKVCSPDRFDQQLDQLMGRYCFVSGQQIIKAVKREAPLPSNACWLTFDDGFSDHYRTVFPILAKREISGTFFAPAGPLLERCVLDVHKIQFILAGTRNVSDIVSLIKDYVVQREAEYDLLPVEDYWDSWAKPSRFGDPKEVTFVKRMLQFALPRSLRKELTRQLFSQYISDNEMMFAEDLYLTQDQAKEMVGAGMHFGHHGFNHEWLNRLSVFEQIEELKQGIEFIKGLGLATKGWLISYPYGAWNTPLLDQVRDLGCIAGVTVKPGTANIAIDDPMLLNRFDTTDFPVDYEENQQKTQFPVPRGLVFRRRNEVVRQVEYRTKFSPGETLPHAKYGLPDKVAFCSRCVISNQRPNSEVEFRHTSSTEKKTIHLDDQGVCDACRTTQRKRDEIDWKRREQALVELCDRHRKDGTTYDCLVPGSGGKDSFYAAHILKYRYGMTPLTVTWAPHMYTDWGWKNFQAWIDAGFDNYLMTPNGRTHRLLTRLALENLFHPFQPFMLGQKALAPKMADLFNMSLVFYGENEAEYGNPTKDAESARRDWSYFSGDDASKIYLGGVSIQELTEDLGVSRADLSPYLPISPDVIENKGIDVHYLGYYLPWHPQGAYYYAVENGGFQASPERTPGTYSKYNSIDDKIDDFHYFTTYIKFGIGRATYDAAQEIRNDEITREEGVALVRKFDGEFPERFASEIYRYLSIPIDEYPVAATRFEQPLMAQDYFEDLCDFFRSPHLWKREHDAWRLRYAVWDT